MIICPGLPDNRVLLGVLSEIRLSYMMRVRLDCWSVFMHLSRWMDELSNPLLRSLDGRVRRWRVNSRILVSENNRFVFFRVPKAGHSTVCSTLVYYDRSLDEGVRQTFLARLDRSVPYPHPREIGYISARRALRTHYLFTFVRNPYRRVLSAYLDKVARGKKAAKNLKYGCTGNGQLKFHEFLDQLKGPTLFNGPHWCPQVALLPQNRGKLDFIGRLERIDTDLEHLVQKIFNRPLSEGVQSWDIHRTRSEEDFAHYYDTTAIETVYNLYREDFLAFGYRRDPDFSQ